MAGYSMIGAFIRIEKGEARPRLTTLLKVSEALGVDVRELTAQLQGNKSAQSEDKSPPFEDLSRLGEATDPMVTLRARDALQRIAEDILAGLVAGDPELQQSL